MNSNPAKKRKFSNGSIAEGPPSGVDREQLQAQRRALPIFPNKWRLIKEIRKQSTVIIIGETGSGKTTQVPQFLYEAKDIIGKGVIAVTQPRRVAAVTISLRVAQEMGVELGGLVGYCVRFDDCTSTNTVIKYMTDGMLLREAIVNPLLKKYSVIILDEAHERTVQTDVLFGIVKAAQKQRKNKLMEPLKIIIMSATMDVDHFSSYFNNAPVIYLVGRTYPVKIMYTKETQDDYKFSALVTVFQIHRESPAQHDILVYLTGQEEIEETVKTIKDISKDLQGYPTLIVLPLYSALPTNLQMKVFKGTPPGYRKVIVATNIAETSITIPGVKYVVDTGVVKSREYNPKNGLDLLRVHRISKAQAWQRSGRAGREASGECYRCMTEKEFAELRDHGIPEIQRCSLANVILQILMMGITDVFNFDFMDKPSTESLTGAIEQLELLGAVKKKEVLEITELGKKMSTFPLEPRFSRIIIASKDLKCTQEILGIISVMSVDSILFTPSSKRDMANEVRKKFISSEGDHITFLNILKAYDNAKRNKQWCYENFVNGRNLETACEIRKQLQDLCAQLAIPIQSCGVNTTAVRECMVTGMFIQAAELQHSGEYMSLGPSRQQVNIHPSSVLFRCKPSYVIFTELVQTSKCYMRDLSIVDPNWLYETSPNYFRKPMNSSGSHLRM